MSTIKIACSHCGQLVTVDENGPRQLICPHCLRSTGPNPARVLPLSRQVRTDTARSSVMLIVFLPLLIVWGIVNVFVVMGSSGAIGPVVIFAMAAALVLYTWLALPRHQTASTIAKAVDGPTTPPSPPTAPPLEPVLDYAMPEQRRPYRAPAPTRPPPHKMGTIAILLGLFLGFLAGGGISAIVWIDLWDYVDQSGPAAIFLVPGGKFLIAVTLIATSRRLRFVGVGLLLSIGLGALIFAFSFVQHFTCHYGI